MALPRCLRNRRQMILGMLAAGCAAAWPLEPAVPAPDTGKAYVAFFLGQGGYLFSWGIPFLESEARKLGLATDVFSYSDVMPAWTNILRKRKDGYKIALVGYSLGNTTTTYLQSHLAVDLLLAISESSLGLNHPIVKTNTKRSVLWYGPDTLSNAGVHDGFNEINYIDRPHLLMDLDPRVVRGVLDELNSLVAKERPDERIVAANAPLANATESQTRSNTKPIVPPINDKIAAAPAPVQQPSKGWLPPTNIITPDVTCTNCWGFEQSLGAAGPDPWMQ